MTVAKQRWLISFEQDLHGGARGSDSMVIDKHPADWLMDCLARTTDKPVVLLFAMPISAAQAKRWRDR